MNIYFLTQDFNHNDKQDNATFHKIEAETLDAAIKIFAKGKYSFAAVRDAEYGDTWLKMFNEPEVGDRALSPFSLKEVIVSNPGQHPGGRAYWVQPAVADYAVFFANEEDHDEDHDEKLIKHYLEIGFRFIKLN
jgi:hypothetical protein